MDSNFSHKQLTARRCNINLPRVVYNTISVVYICLLIVLIILLSAKQCKTGLTAVMPRLDAPKL